MNTNIAPRGWDKVEGGQEIEPIGYLTSYAGEKGMRVIGTCCAEKVGVVNSPVYRGNVYPYRQTCAECGKVLVAGRPCGSKEPCNSGLPYRTEHAEGTHTHWCELFNGE